MLRQRAAWRKEAAEPHDRERPCGQTEGPDCGEEEDMELIFEEKYSRMKEAMDLLSMAVNTDEAERRKLLQNLEKLGGDMEEGIALQKELLEVAGRIRVTDPMRRYFECYGGKGQGSPARSLICTFQAENTDTIRELKEKVLGGLSAFPLDAFPDFSSYDGQDMALPLEGERGSFLSSVKKLDMDEKFKARLIFAFQDPEGSLDELGGLLEQAAGLLEPYRERMEAEVEKGKERWKEYFASHDLDEFLSLIGVSLDSGAYSGIRIRWKVVSGVTLVLKIEDENRSGMLKVDMGVLIDEKALRFLKKGNEREALQLLADPVKLDILLYISQTPHYGRELAERFGLSTATISYHMQDLLNEGLVSVSQQGKRVYYSLDRDRIRLVLEWLQRVLLE